MKKEFLSPAIQCIQMDELESICITSEINVEGKTDHFDSRRSGWGLYDDEEDKFYEE